MSSEHILKVSRGYQDIWKRALIKTEFTPDLTTLTARNYNSFSGIHYLISKFLSNHPYEHQKILSIGVGKGEEIFELSKKFPSAEFYGLDTSFEVLRLLEKKIKKRKKEDVHVLCASTFNLPFRDNLVFDGIIAAQIFDLLYDDEVHSLLNEMNVHTSQGSRLYSTIYGDATDEHWLQEPFWLGMSLDKRKDWRHVHHEVYKMPEISPYAAGIFEVREKV